MVTYEQLCHKCQPVLLSVVTDFVASLNVNPFVTKHYCAPESFPAIRYGTNIRCSEI